MICDLDAHYFRSYYPFHNITLKMQTQSSINKDFFCFEKSKTKDPKSILLYYNTTKSTKKEDKKDKKKDSKDTNSNILENKKNKSWLLTIILLML